MKRSGNYIIMEKGSCGYVRQREKDEMIIKKKIMMINKEQRGKSSGKGIQHLITRGDENL